MSFPAYPVYKNSGVDWLGEIPEGWSIKPLWALFRRHKLTGFPDEQLLSVYRDYGVIPKASRDDNFNKPSDDLGAYQLVQIGDLAINKMKAWQGSVGISSHKGIVSPAYHVYAPSHSEASQYLHHLFRCNEYIAGYLANSKGIRVNQWDLEPQQHSRMSVLLPSFQEQTQIARFLDHETARIDALIEEQQRLIELLKEKCQAVISHAVTKGLDPTVPMKDSGVDWLGEVPAHWVVGPLRWYATIQGGIAKGKDYEGRETVSLPYLRVANVQNGFVDLTEVKEISVLESEVERYSLRSGDVLMNEGGDNDKLGRGTVWQGQIEPCLHQNHVFAIRPNDLLSAEWLTAFTQCDQARSYFFLNSKQSTNLASISASNVMSLALPIPSVAEQKEILSVLNESRVAHEELVNLATSTVEFLQERRSALISAAVTGKIDVRGWQSPANAKTPELVEEAV